MRDYLSQLKETLQTLCSANPFPQTQIFSSSNYLLPYGGHMALMKLASETDVHVFIRAGNMKWPVITAPRALNVQSAPRIQIRESWQKNFPLPRSRHQRPPHPLKPGASGVSTALHCSSPVATPAIPPWHLHMSRSIWNAPKLPTRLEIAGEGDKIPRPNCDFQSRKLNHAFLVDELVVLCNVELFPFQRLFSSRRSQLAAFLHLRQLAIEIWVHWECDAYYEASTVVDAIVGLCNELRDRIELGVKVALCRARPYGIETFEFRKEIDISWM